MTAPSRATGPHPIVVFGNAEQKARWLPRLVRDQDQCAFGITEPDAGLNTTIKTFAEKVPGGYVVHGQKVWTSTAQVASKIMLLTRTTNLEDCKRPTDGITIFFADLDRSKAGCLRSRHSHRYSGSKKPSSPLAAMPGRWSPPPRSNPPTESSS